MGEELQLTLLGNIELRRGGISITGFNSSKTQALLCYLAVTGRPHSRPALVGLLWPDLPETNAQRNLRKALTNLRKLVDPHLSISRQVVAFNRDSPYWLDTEAFETKVRDTSAEANIERLRQAVELYRGDFMEGFYVHNAPTFEEWVRTQRARLRGLALQALHTLAAHYTQQGDAGRALGLDYTTRLLALDPWREEAHRQMMLLLALGGQRSAALAQYEICRQVLAEEFGVEPGAETMALYERIRDNDLSRGISSSGGAQVEKDRSDWQAESSFSSHSAILPVFLTDGEEEPVGAEMPIFVARESELAQLGGFLDLTLAGQGRVAFVVGGAGRGKTMLLKEFARRAQKKNTDLIVASGHCNAFSGIGDPYLPFCEILELLSGDVESRWAAGSINREQARRLWTLLPHTVEALVNVGPDLIDIFISGTALITRATTAVPGAAGWLVQLETLLARNAANQRLANLRQHDIFSQYTKVLQVLARQRLLLLILDDLQWADAGSISLLFDLGRRLEGHQILIVGIYRPGEVTLGRNGERYPLEPVVNEFRRLFGDIQIDLSRTEGRDFVESFLETMPNRLEAGFKEAFFQRTRGHALFTVEMFRGMQERGDLVQDESGQWVEGKPLNWSTLPARVEGVIGERIGRLPAEQQEALKVASVEGEDFTAEVVARVQGVDARVLVKQLSSKLDKQHRLVRSQGSQRLGTQLVSRFHFRHILFQRYLYNSVAETERAYLHEAVGNTLEQLYAQQTDAVAIELARHFQMAGLAEKAVEYLHKAGEKAVQRYANHEAITLFNEALALLNSLPDTSVRLLREISLQIALGNVLMTIKGFAALEVEQAYGRARELCQHVGETPQLFPILHGLFRYYLVRAALQTIRELGEQIVRLTKQQQNTSLFLPAQLTTGIASFFMGRFAPARRHFDQGTSLYDPQHHQAHVLLFGQDAMTPCLSHLALTLWHLGYPDQALEKNHQALALAHELSHPFSQAAALTYAGWFHQLLRETSPTQEQSEATVRLSSKQGFVFWAAMGTVLGGWALAEQGEIEQGIAQMRQGLATWQAMGAELILPYFLALLSEAFGKIGQIEEGLAILTEALDVVNKSEERNYEAELYRIRGELLLMRDQTTEAEECFRLAVDIARRQGSKSLELRATVSLSRLWLELGKKDESLQMLTEIYNWFTEGFDTVDLKEAKALLEEMS